MEEAVYWYAVAAVLLFLKMFAISAYQGFHRIGKMTFKTPEDAAFLGKEPVMEELPQIQRSARAWLNDLENIPIFLCLGLAYILVDASPDSAVWLFMIFTAARYVHTLCYLIGLQPWRTLAYFVGVGCTFAMCVQILAALP
ncbi:MAPEG family protein [Zhongshania arctica]|uniref:Microsomal glutathione S-transferase 1 n=1 Tax=Zhongshania arctica TaxID=3238302 RepID=A0ABV3TVB5_9GAMM|tara:strand:+ start:3693 stop:4115 length:423 start_codon:yes stop_codon:yes gene_type:complete